ncbi:hypothetical protein OpiT1DRAFT_02965 [Opitutaceae bacterium TAV1]|nr:hypothetical protein OpiT1DRAFT_02965 [Opitutaceae bacterium TAV1]
MHHVRLDALIACQVVSTFFACLPVFSFPAMAWRIEEHVVRGEIDNRIRGKVTARLWFCGHEDTPMEIVLTGNAHPDLHGRFITFTNPDPKPGLPAGLRMAQRGTAGDITASRKVKIPDVPLDRIVDYYKTGKKLPYHWGNVLYLEWYSETNGRIVIEAPYDLRLSPDAPAWELTPEEKAARDAELAAAEAEALADSVDGDGFATLIRNPDFTEEEDTRDAGDRETRVDEDDDEWRPPTEEEAEKMQADSDLLVDRIMARMEREGDDADYEKILEEELERRRKERGEPDPTPEELAEREQRIEEFNAATEEVMAEMEAEKWKKAADDGDVSPDDGDDDTHPLVRRALDFGMRVHHDIEERNWLPGDAHREHPVFLLSTGLMCVGPKLGGALDGEEDWPPPLLFTASIIVRLKKAAGFIEDALLAAESCAEQNLVDPDWLADVVRETREIGAAINALIAELRAHLKRGRG